MKNVNLIFILIFLYFTIVLTQRPKKLPVGAIFVNTEDDAEIAFRTAIENSNINERNFELIPIIKYSKSMEGFTLETLACELVAEGVIAIFGSPSPKSGIIAAICHTLEIPHILYEYKKQIRHFELPFHTMTISVHPNDLKLSGAYASVIQSLNWDRYAIIYESERELIQLQDVLQIHNPDSRPVVVRQLPLDESDFRPFLKNIRELKIPCYIIHCDIKNIYPLLKQATELNMLGEYQSIFIASLDTHSINIQDLAYSLKSNLTTMRIIDPTDFMIKNIVHDWEQRERHYGRYFKVLPNQVKTNMVLANDAVLVFSKGLAALDIIDRISVPKLKCKEMRKWSFGRQIINSIKNRTEEGATGRIDFDNNGQRDIFNVQILEYSKIGKNFTEIAIWNAVNGINNVDDDSQRRRDDIIANKLFAVSSRLGEPFLFDLTVNSNETLYGNNRYEGYSMDLIAAIAKIVGFKYEFVITENYGSIDEKTGKWTGIIREVMDGNVDLGICDLTMTAARRQVVDFTPPFMTLGITLMYTQPPKIKTNLFSFVMPFSQEIWNKIGIAFIVLFFVAFISARMAPAEWENPHPCNPNPTELEIVWNLKNTFWLTFGFLMGQGCDLLPKATSVRIMSGFIWFFALMMLNSYTANLTAFLTTSGNLATFKTVQELANQKKVKYGVLKGGSTQGFFRESNDSLYQKMWSIMESEDPSVYADSNDEGEKRIGTSKRLYAFFMESSIVEYKIERNCDLLQIGSWLDYKTYGIAMPFNSPYRKEVSEAVLKLGESGVLADLKRKWWKQMHGGGKCTVKSSKPTNTGPIPLAITNVGGAFLVVGMGIFIGFIIAFVEFFWNLQIVSKEEKITLGEAFKLEALFALKFWKTSKPVSTSNTSGGDSMSKRSLKSLAQSQSLSELKNINNKNLKTDRNKIHGSEVSIRSIKFLDVTNNDKTDNVSTKSRKNSCINLKIQLNWTCPDPITRQILIVISLDGFRNDYLKRNITPSFNNFRANGVYSHYLKTILFPNALSTHHTIATGYYASKHGVVGHTTFTGRDYLKWFGYSEELYTYNNGIIPIWLLNERNGGTSASMMWPGAEFPAGAERKKPTYSIRYNRHIKLEDTLEQIVNWLNRTRNQPNLIMAYINEPDRIGHFKGPNDKINLTETLKRLDKFPSDLNHKINQLRLSHRVNVIYLSDHGMWPVISKNFKNLSTLPNCQDYYKFIGRHTYLEMARTYKNRFNIKCEEDIRQTYGDEVFLTREDLEAKKEMNLDRASNSMILAKKGYAWGDNMWPLLFEYKMGYNMPDKENTEYGVHGYEDDNDAIFMAKGPQFVSDQIHPAFKMVDFYSLFARLLGIEGNFANDGDFNRIVGLLKVPRELIKWNRSFIVIGLCAVCHCIVFFIVVNIYRYNIAKNDDEIGKYNKNDKELQNIIKHR